MKWIVKPTGIVRRMDDLGRIVLPKEIRKTLRMKVGTPLEIYIDRDSKIILRKYAPIIELTDYTDEYASALSESLQCGIIITDSEQVISVSSLSNKEYSKKRIGETLIQLMEEKKTKEYGEGGYHLIGEEKIYSQLVLTPILQGSNCIGSITAVQTTSKLSEVHVKTLESAALFLGRAMDLHATRV